MEEISFDRIIRRLASCLAKDEKCTQHQMKRLLYHVPTIAPGDRKPFSIDSRDRSSLLSCCLFLVRSQARHADLVVPQILMLMKNLGSIEFSRLKATQAHLGVHVQNFCNLLLQTISYVGSLSSHYRDRIVHAQLELFELVATCITTSTIRSSEAKDGGLASSPSILTIHIFSGICRGMLGYVDADSLSVFLEDVNEKQSLASPLRKNMLDMDKNLWLAVVDKIKILLEKKTFINLERGQQLGDHNLNFSVMEAMSSLLCDITTDLTMTGEYPAVMASCFASAKSLLAWCRSEILVMSMQKKTADSAYVAPVCQNAASILACSLSTDPEVMVAQMVDTINNPRGEYPYLVLFSQYTRCCFDAISTLSERFPMVASTSVDFFRNFLLHPSVMLQKLWEQESTKAGRSYSVQDILVPSTGDRPINILVNGCLAGLARSLRSGTRLDSNFVKALVSITSHGLYPANKNDKSTDLRQSMATLVLGRAACAFSDTPEIAQDVISILLQRFCTFPSQVDTVIVHTLTDLALSSPDVCYNVVLSRFGKVIMESSAVVYSGDDQKVQALRLPSSAVTKSLAVMSKRLPTQSLILDYTLRLLDIFVQLGVEYKKNEASATLKASAYSGNLGVLIPPLAVAFSRLTLDFEQKGRMQRLIRDFWLYVVIFGLDIPSLWVKEWSDGIRVIAAKSLALVGTDHLRSELHYNTPLKEDHFARTDLNSVRQMLINTVSSQPEFIQLVGKMSSQQCLYLLSVLHLEVVRVQADTLLVGNIFQYIEDRAVQVDKAGMLQCLYSIASRVFSVFLSLLASKPPSPQLEHELVLHTQLLLVKFNHSQKEVRRLADKCLSQLVDKYPNMLWNHNVIKTILDLIQVLHQALETNRNTLISVTLAVPRTEHSLVLPSQPTARQSIVQDFYLRCEGFLLEAMKWAPSATLSLLQQYLEEKQVYLQQASVHHGLALAVKTLLKWDQSDGSSLPQTPGASSASTLQPLKLSWALNSGASQKALYLGQIQGMKRAMEMTVGQGVSAWDALATHVLAGLAQARDSKDKLGESLMLTSALTISYPGVNNRLLHQLCFIPTQVFTSEVLHVAVSGWQWTIAARPDLEFQLISKVTLAFRWTHSQRIGMFSCDPPEVNPFLVSADTPSIAIPPVPDVEPHCVWIKFLQDWFSVSKYCSSDMVKTLVQLLHSCLSLKTGAGNVLMHHVSALRACFLLLSLALSVLQGAYHTNIISRNLLREQVYNTALDYFCCSLSWPKTDCLDEIQALVDFWLLLRSDKKHMLSCLPTDYLKLSDLVLSSDQDQRMDFFERKDSIVGPQQGTWLNTLAMTNTSAPRKVQDSLRSEESQQVLKNCLKQRQLILLLVTKEVERLCTWHSPLNPSEVVLDGIQELNNWTGQTIIPLKNWSDFAKITWNINPCLAVNLAVRFKDLPMFSREVCSLVQRFPSSVCDTPVALSLFATMETIQQDRPDLSYIMMWSSPSPLVALSYLSQQYPYHSLTSQFAVKVLRSVPPESLLVYVPQIVQALRYDKLGYVKDYLLWLAKKSQLLAHQLVWNMKTNIYTDEHATVLDPVLGSTLESLVKSIVGSLEGPTQSFFHREFNFFDEITSISGKIRPLEKSQRRQACQDLLCQIKLEQGVYLPSNPEAVIVEIDYTSGIPMQSAAKAPFLARFKVQRCNLKEIEEFNMSRPDTTPSGSNGAAVNHHLKGETYWQAAIFKVGDDVRQDMLALQFITLFKRIFELVGLDLYLFPYRVVATSPGCGVIECIPNAKSRDQLGRQTDFSLYQYFLQTYGHETSLPFEEARGNFIKSMAAYSVLTSLLQIKDRHNGNIMVDTSGHIVHIDFGFMFESSPGGNMGFEPDMKLTKEYIEIMGGSVDSPFFKSFEKSCVRAFLAVRPYLEELVSLVALMLDSGLPCFRGETIKRFRVRMFPECSEKMAAAGVHKVVQDSTQNLRTKLYDIIQYAQNEIPY